MFAIVAAILLAEYFAQVRRVKHEYEKARSFVEDVVFSFNRQLRQEARQVEVSAYKVESVSSRVDTAVSMLGELENNIHAIKKTLHAESQERELLTVRLANLEKSTQETVASNERLLSKVAALEAQGERPSYTLDTGFEAVIPIRREKTLAQLTGTEVSVLELLISGGSKTAPEIKESLKLSREHTARLMKKLYEQGYLERETGKIPFRYTVKKEMGKVLKKAEGETT